MEHTPAADELVIPSLIDRLIDNNSDQLYEAAGNYLQKLAQYQVSICRDIENLLNTYINTKIITYPNSLRQSLVNYGIRDFNSYDFEAPATKDEITQQIKAALEIFEPRFKNIQIVWLDNSANETSSLQFQIEAQLQIEPVPKSIALNTTLNSITGNFIIKSNQHE